VVWDPAWGTGNLTRDYKFKELYVSTLVYADIETANQMGYNPEATKFQFDFLNDSYEYLPKGLKTAIENGRQIIILMNPPYGTARTGNRNKGDKSGLANTTVGKKMQVEKYDKSSAQLYAQFIYRFTQEFIGNFNLCFFSKSSYKTSTSFKRLRNDMRNKYEFTKGFIFQATHFDSTSEEWGVDFSIFSGGKQNYQEFEMDILDYNVKDGFIYLGTKKLWSTDSIQRACDWVRNFTPKKQNISVEYPNMTSALKFKPSKKKVGIQGYLGGYCELSNTVYHNSQGVSLVSGIGIIGNTVSVPIYSKNLNSITTMFSAKKLVQQNWINDKDEYMAPNTSSSVYKIFSNDSIVHSLFNNSSEQSSIRQVEYNGVTWDVKNQFFWMSKEEMVNLANQNNYGELYNDARTDSDRHVYNLLFGEQRIYDQLSDEAKDVLDSASNLVRLSFGMRRNFADDTNHLNSWDAGYAQLKLLWKEYYPEQFKEFRTKYKVLEDKMRPMVYELGFLLK
jgi:hypothetical protein